MLLIHPSVCWILCYNHQELRPGPFNNVYVSEKLRIHDRGVGEVLEVVRPKVGAAEGRVGGGSGGNFL